MQPGSKVEAVTNFEEVARQWPMLQYPKRGDVLTVATVTPHPNKKMRQIGGVMLTFVELDNWGIASKQITGKPNFLELQILGGLKVKMNIKEGTSEFVSLIDKMQPMVDEYKRKGLMP